MLIEGYSRSGGVEVKGGKLESQFGRVHNRTVTSNQIFEYRFESSTLATMMLSVVLARNDQRRKFGVGLDAVDLLERSSRNCEVVVLLLRCRCSGLQQYDGYLQTGGSRGVERGTDARIPNSCSSALKKSDLTQSGVCST